MPRRMDKVAGAAFGGGIDPLPPKPTKIKSYAHLLLHSWMCLLAACRSFTFSFAVADGRQHTCGEAWQMGYISTRRNVAALQPSFAGGLASYFANQSGEPCRHSPIPSWRRPATTTVFQCAGFREPSAKSSPIHRDAAVVCVMSSRPQKKKLLLAFQRLLMGRVRPGCRLLQTSDSRSKPRGSFRQGLVEIAVQKN